MKKLIVTVCALAVLTACGKSSCMSGSGSSHASSSLVSELTQKVGDKVYFAFDSSSLSEESKTTLLAQAELMKKNQGIPFQLEGHTDARGTGEYNIGLGERRANAAKNFLASQGVVNQLTVTSYGKEKLLDAGTTPEAHTKNRRVVTVANQQFSWATSFAPALRELRRGFSFSMIKGILLIAPLFLLGYAVCVIFVGLQVLVCFLREASPSL